MTYYIYKIYEKNINDIFYIGSTNNINKRKFSHKKNTNNKVSKKYNIKLYQYIRLCGGWDNFNMDIYEILDTNDKIECLKKECQLVKELKPQLNTVINICNKV